MQQPEGVADSAVERVVGLSQGLPVTGNNEVGLVTMQELLQPASDSRAEVRQGGRKQESHDRNTVVDMRVHGYGGDVSWEHTGCVLQTVRSPAKGQGQG